MENISMAEYIEREAALQAVAENNYTEDITLKGYDRIIRAIYDIPASDVAPVRHGRWLDCIPYNPEFNGYECSECGAKYQGFSPDNYCPNCGAKNGW